MKSVINVMKNIGVAVLAVLRGMKEGIFGVILVVLLLVGGFTYISYRNYMADLAVVTLTSTAHNQIRSELEITGSLYYQEVSEVSVPQGCHVEEVFVKQGDAVEAETPILRVKMADLQIVRLNKQLQIEALEDVEEEGGTEGELAYWKKELLLEEIEELEQLIVADGMVKVADVISLEGEGSVISSGYVISQAYESGDLTTAEVPITIGFPEGGCYLEWQVSAKDHKEYTGTARIRGQKEDLVWDTPVYKDGVYTYRSEVPVPEDFVHGEQVQITLNYVSEDYKAVLPKGCIRYDADGSTYVYEVATRKCNFGEEQYVRKIGVTIIEQDDTRVAVKASLYGIVLRSTKELQDMMAVMVIEE